ncbi:RNA polymerase sigma factor SigZ [Pseudoalteromonas sp. JBTF-M23]|uniref:RNA polymerase sigma factor SigZ n=1 Tax=Pseudoalteromonas caenipelagi TaxID=2726988 RepID=A0A849VJE4_9GAMM|nr:RNA polymerase sigma factor SigZ [Pseudoalteromonas caenipelagi]NOU51924.1 RNA polymerase sigma factor SigZ [Pseudoalteromonas caenipelagi]
MLAEWESHKQQLRSYIARQISDQEVVEDILQEVFIKASDNLQQLKAKGSLRSWLYTITRNTIIDYYRKRTNYEELPDDLAQESKDLIEQNYKVLSGCLRPLLQELPDKYRIPLELSELEGMSQQDVATSLGLSLSGAKSRVQRGRAKLRELMLACCEFEMSKGEITDFTPKSETGKKCYDRVRKRYT